jgi:hypothetical protein
VAGLSGNWRYRRRSGVRICLDFADAEIGDPIHFFEALFKESLVFPFFRFPGIPKGHVRVKERPHLPDEALVASESFFHRLTSAHKLHNFDFRA